MEKKTKLGVVLLSGGLDSATAAAVALREGYDLMALSVRYGQRHDREVAAARDVAGRLRIRHVVAEFPAFRGLARRSALTSPSEFALPENRPPDQMGKDIPITYVPLRNTFLLTLAAAALESEALARFEEGTLRPEGLEAAVIIGANILDYSGYPDCRPEYFEKISAALTMGSKIGSFHRVPIRIEAPLIRMSKAEIVRKALELDAPVECTWSCYAGGEAPCGRCDSCILRRKGFEDAGAADPALSRTR